MNSITSVLGMVATEAAEAVLEDAPLRSRPDTPVLDYKLELVIQADDTLAWVED